MASTGVNVLRWSSLGLGVAYGIYHQAGISAADKLRDNQKEYERKQSLINQARQEFQRKKAPKQSGAVNDLSDPKFDLEAWLSSVEKQQ